MKVTPVNQWIVAIAASIGLFVGAIMGALGWAFQAHVLGISIFSGLLTGLICAYLLKWMFFGEQLIKTTSQMFSFGPFQGQIQVGTMGQQVRRVTVPPVQHHHHPAPRQPPKEAEKPKPQLKKRKNEPEVDVEID